MSLNDYTSFRDVQHYGNPSLIDNIETNLKHYFDWAFLKIGAWQEVDLTTTGVYGGGFYELHDTHNESRVRRISYQSARKDWVYETGVDYNSPCLNIQTITYDSGQQFATLQLYPYENVYFLSGDTVAITNNPGYNGQYSVYSGGLNTIVLDNVPANINSSGGCIYGIYNPSLPIIYVNGVENTDNTINYPLGQVVFDSQLPINSVVTATYSFRNVQTYISDQVPWAYELQYDSFDPSDLQWTQNVDSGNYSKGGAKRVQLPAVLIETVGNGTASPFQLGSLTARLKQEVICTVVSQNKFERNNITDILRKLKHKTIYLYDQYQVHKRDYNSLDYDGSVNASGLVYKDIVKQQVLRWKPAFFYDVKVSAVETKTPDLYMSKVRLTIEVID